MIYNIETYECMPCSLTDFTINGVEANVYDFGLTYDIGEPEENEYCHDMQFSKSLPTEKVLEKYSINLAEYADIIQELTDNLDIGSCDMCF